MKIYQDIFSGNELISDSYPMTEIYDGVGFEVQSTMLVVKEDDIDIGCGNAFDNPDGKKEEEGEQAAVEKVNNVLDSFHYNEDTMMDKAYFSKYIKGYMKKVLDHLTAKNPGRVEAFKAGAKDMVTWILSNFDEFKFYTPQDYDNENMLIISYFKKPEDEAPYFIYFKDGLKFYKA